MVKCGPKQRQPSQRELRRLWQQETAERRAADPTSPNKPKLRTPRKRIGIRRSSIRSQGTPLSPTKLARIKEISEGTEGNDGLTTQKRRRRKAKKVADLEEESGRGASSLSEEVNKILMKTAISTGDARITSLPTIESRLQQPATQASLHSNELPASALHTSDETPVRCPSPSTLFSPRSFKSTLVSSQDARNAQLSNETLRRASSHSGYRARQPSATEHISGKAYANIQRSRSSAPHPVARSSLLLQNRASDYLTNSSHLPPSRPSSLPAQPKNHTEGHVGLNTQPTKPFIRSCCPNGKASNPFRSSYPNMTSANVPTPKEDPLFASQKYLPQKPSTNNVGTPCPPNIQPPPRSIIQTSSESTAPSQGSVPAARSVPNPKEPSCPPPSPTVQRAEALAKLAEYLKQRTARVPLSSSGSLRSQPTQTTTIPRSMTATTATTTVPRSRLSSSTLAENVPSRKTPTPRIRDTIADSRTRLPGSSILYGRSSDSTSEIAMAAGRKSADIKHGAPSRPIGITLHSKLNGMMKPRSIKPDQITDDGDPIQRGVLKKVQMQGPEKSTTTLPIIPNVPSASSKTISIPNARRTGVKQPTAHTFMSVEYLAFIDFAQRRSRLNEATPMEPKFNATAQQDEKPLRGGEQRVPLQTLTNKATVSKTTVLSSPTLNKLPHLHRMFAEDDGRHMPGAFIEEAVQTLADNGLVRIPTSGESVKSVANGSKWRKVRTYLKTVVGKK